MNEKDREITLSILLNMYMKSIKKGGSVPSDLMAVALEQITELALPNDEQLQALVASNKAERAVRHMMQIDAEELPRPTA
jgi:hypothetical protein